MLGAKNTFQTFLLIMDKISLYWDISFYKEPLFIVGVHILVADLIPLVGKCILGEDVFLILEECIFYKWSLFGVKSVSLSLCLGDENSISIFSVFQRFYIPLMSCTFHNLRSFVVWTGPPCNYIYVPWLGLILFLKQYIFFESSHLSECVQSFTKNIPFPSNVEGVYSWSPSPSKDVILIKDLLYF